VRLEDVRLLHRSGVGVLGRDAQGILHVDQEVVGMDSTPTANPERLRFAATRLPRTMDLSNKVGGVSNWTWCTAGDRVDYPADGFRPTAGVVSVVRLTRCRRPLKWWASGCRSVDTGIPHPEGSIISDRLDPLIYVSRHSRHGMKSIVPGVPGTWRPA
jgi:hypothetical protein